MSNNQPKIFLIVEFAWPGVITEEIGKKSANLHENVSNADWIDDPVVAYGGISQGLPCIWIFSLNDYASLNKLIHPTLSKGNDVSLAFNNFFNEMVNVQTKIKHEVQFL